MECASARIIDTHNVRSVRHRSAIAIYIYVASYAYSNSSQL